MKNPILILLLFVFSCYEKDEHFIPPVYNFEISKYLGDWHEIARTDNNFEKDCTQVTANYQMRDDGGINVSNECLKNGALKQAKGWAYFKDSSDVGSLKVTFFWPFYGNYYVIYVDETYSHAIVYGGNPKYIWILAREKQISNAKLQYLLLKIKAFQLDEKSLIISKTAISN